MGRDVLRFRSAVQFQVVSGCNSIVVGAVFQFMSVGTMVRTHKVVPLLLIGWFIAPSNWLCTKHIIIHLQ